MANSNSAAGIYLAGQSASATFLEYTARTSSEISDSLFRWEPEVDAEPQSAKILSSTTTTMNCFGRPRRRESSQSSSKYEERRRSFDILLWNTKTRPTSPSHASRLEHDMKRTHQTTSYANTFAAYTPRLSSSEAGPSSSPPRYHPRQSIPSDVSNHPRSFLSAPDNVNDVENIQVADQAQRSGAKQKKVASEIPQVEQVAKDTTLNKIHAIDPACFQSIVPFDYSCLDDLDEELILRPRSAFEEVCWTTAVHNVPRRSYQVVNARPSSSHSSRAATPTASDHHPRNKAPRLAMRESLPTPPRSNRSPSVKESPITQEIPQVDVFAVTDHDTESESGAETEREEVDHWTVSSTSTEPAVLMVAGRKNLTILGNHRVVGADEKAMNRKPSIEEVFVSSGSLSSEHGKSEKLHSDINRHHDDDCYQVGLDKQEDLDADTDADGRSFISFDGDDEYDDDDTPMHTPPHTPRHTPRHPQSLPALRSYAHQRTNELQLLLSPASLQYSGLTNPQHESVAFYPIPASSLAISKSKSKMKTAKFGRASVKRDGQRYVENLGISVAKFCQAAFPISGRAVKR
ncbi:hypothetical protein GYMLUDRAFT_43249 [Collybiopsis luxurians FD-317 M1]|uniref:Uncharacterized protein n=1 Tax=Collybiopsis luxurians FD-317 M1 TaxID=944289 RepID=A0A0D0CQ78_9AGAR|nr:hypothetical protein GYMLUDRAFT_43249 [Collybiopsis luxurians FD-317 M1]